MKWYCYSALIIVMNMSVYSMDRHYESQETEEQSVQSPCDTLAAVINQVGQSLKRGTEFVINQLDRDVVVETVLAVSISKLYHAHRD
jgi:hypothetical protein